MSALPDPDPLLTLSAPVLRDRIRDGEITAVSLTRACLDRIAALDGTLRAWAFVDSEGALAQARRIDARRNQGEALGPLAGLPVGLKDVIDVAGLPGENGCPVDEGRLPEQDAAAVARLRTADAVILGKTTTTELAFLAPSPARNPANPTHTPGGSSAGSAAAVAAAMVPLAVGTQTGGSVIRPASFCGCVGFKPSRGAIPLDGVLLQSHTLDTLGSFARDAAGAVLLAEVMAGTDWSADAEAPRLSALHPPGWEQASPAARAAFDSFAEGLGLTPRPFPGYGSQAAGVRETINLAEMTHHYRRYAEDLDALAPETRAAIIAGAKTSAPSYLVALEWRRGFIRLLAPLWDQADVQITPAALGAAPKGFASTGNALFNGLWTLAGAPALTLPLMTAEDGMPLGLQIIGPPGGEARVAKAALWLEKRAAAG